MNMIMIEEYMMSMASLCDAVSVCAVFTPGVKLTLITPGRQIFRADTLQADIR